MVSDTICNTYDDLLAVALRAEQLGFGAFFRSDHYLNMGADSGLPCPTDAWITLCGSQRSKSNFAAATMPEIVVSPATESEPLHRLQAPTEAAGSWILSQKTPPDTSPKRRRSCGK